LSYITIMLVIKGKIQGERTYEYVRRGTSESPTDLRTVPRIHHKLHKVPFTKWCEDYEEEVSTILEDLMDAIQGMTVNPTHIMHFNHNELKNNLLQWIYDCSLSSNRNFRGMQQYQL
jgi:hypothetical protein